MKFTNIETVFKAANGPTQIALDLRLHQWTVERWRKTGIPQKYWNYLIEKVDVTPAELFSMNNKIKAPR